MSTVDTIWPSVESDLSDDDVLRAYEPSVLPWLRMNFISSLDGAATHDGLSGGLGDDVDGHLFELLRWWADVVLVGAGTIRKENYGAIRLPDQAVRWRIDHGLAEQPVLAVVSKSLDLDPRSAIFADAPVKPLVYSTTSAPTGRQAALADVAHVIEAGDDLADPVTIREDLHQRGYKRIHCEGGPTLFGIFIAADALDELCLTLGPTLEAGPAPRISNENELVASPMKLTTVLRSGDELFIRYTRSR